MPYVAMAPKSPTREVIASRVRDLRGASFSDVHLGHPQTPTEHIIKNLRRAFPPTEETAALDVIFLVGDLFDAGLAYSDSHIPMIEEWALGFLMQCARNGTAVRVTEGTHSHDRGQSRMFEKLQTQHQIPVDLLYVTQVSVEVNEKLGISILYVPDFTTIDEETIWQRVLTAMREAGVDQVDYANVHGGFTYQLPDIPELQRVCHRMERYLGIVKQYIFSGHIHIPSVYERIYCNGSFDRLNHGEEMPKGHWRFYAPKGGKDCIEFVETKQALRYDTVVCTEMPLDEAMRVVETRACELPVGSHIRVEAERAHPIFLSMARFRQSYGNLRWTMKSVAQGKEAEINGDHEPVTTPAVREPLTSETLGGILLARLERRNVLPTVLARAKELLPTYL